MSKKTFFLIDGTTLTGEIRRLSSSTVDIVDEYGRLWTLFWRHVVKIYNGERKGGDE